MRDHPAGTWAHLQSQLSDKFGDISDRQHALALLRRTKQKMGESAQVYAQRLRTIAEEAFDPPPPPKVGVWEQV